MSFSFSPFSTALAKFHFSSLSLTPMCMRTLTVTLKISLSNFNTPIHSHLYTVYMTNNCLLEAFWVELLSFSHVLGSIYGQEQQVVIAKLSHQSVEAQLDCCALLELRGRASFLSRAQYTLGHHSQTCLLLWLVSTPNSMTKIVSSDVVDEK